MIKFSQLVTAGSFRPQVDSPTSNSFRLHLRIFELPSNTVHCFWSTTDKTNVSISMSYLPYSRRFLSGGKIKQTSTPSPPVRYFLLSFVVLFDCDCGRLDLLQHFPDPVFHIVRKKNMAVNSVYAATFLESFWHQVFNMRRSVRLTARAVDEITSRTAEVAQISGSTSTTDYTGKKEKSSRRREPENPRNPRRRNGAGRKALMIKTKMNRKWVRWKAQLSLKKK